MAQTVIVNVGIYDSMRIRFLALVLGLWIILKRFTKWAWNPTGFFSIELRDNPPSCLVDTTLGQHKYVKLKGIKFHYVEAGGRSQPLVVLLHGFPDCWLSWRSQINALSDHFRVVALDLKGFGDSDKPVKRSSYRIEAILEELKQFIHSLGVTKCTIIGHDLGALLGWYLVHREPELVEKFVTVACPHPNLYWQTISTHSYFNSQWLKFIQLPYLPEIDAMKEDINIINDHFSHLQNNGKKNNYLEAYKYAFSRKEDWTGPINYYRNLPFTRISEDSAQIKTSTLLVTGNNKSQYAKLEGVVQSTDYCEKFHVKIIDGAGHFPHQENPEMFNKVVLKFLKVSTIAEKQVENRSPSQGLIGHFFGAVSNTVKYGNSVIDSVQKKTGGSIPTSLGLSSQNKDK